MNLSGSTQKKPIGVSLKLVMFFFYNVACWLQLENEYNLGMNWENVMRNYNVCLMVSAE